MSRTATSHDSIQIINKKKKEVAIFIIITLIVLIVLITFPVRMMTVKVMQINNEIEGKRRIKEQLDEKIENLTQLNTEYQELREDLKDLPLIFPNQGDYSLFTTNLDEIAKANNFRLASVNFSEERTRRQDVPFETLNFWDANISVAGRRTDLIHLLEDIEKMPMLPTVNRVSFRNETDDDDLLNFTITVRIYGVNMQGVYIDI